MKSKITILVHAILVAILIIGLITPNGIRGAVSNNVWSLAFIKRVINKTTPFTDSGTPPTTHAHAGLLLAHQALEENDINLALLYLKPTLNTNDQLALQTYAHILFLQKEYTDAILIWKYLGQWFTLEQASRVLSQEGDIDNLILTYQSAYELFPERYAIHLQRSMRTKANNFIEENLYVQAIDIYQEMLSQFPEEISIYIDLAWSYFHNEQPDKALQIIEQGSVINNEDSTYFVEAAKIYEQMVLPQKALDAYQHALNLNPNLQSALQGIENLSNPNEEN